MRTKLLQRVEKYRVRGGPFGTQESDGPNGHFRIIGPRGRLHVIASNGAGWEHVSVSLPARTPSWEEMCFIKNLFWEPNEVVIQFHPAESDYVNNHPYCLHLWRPTNAAVPTPPTILVGIK